MQGGPRAGLRSQQDVHRAHRERKALAPRGRTGLAIAVFVELTTDAFQETFQAQAAQKRAGGNRTGGAGRKSVRRPLRGIEIKEDTYAYLKVVRSDGREIRLFDSSSSTGLSSGGYSNFMLQSVQEARMEKHQLVETFGDSYIFFFGEAPRFIDVAAMLLNTHDFNWRAEWWQNYHEYLRGTRLAEMGARVYLFYDDLVIEGFIINAAATESAQVQHQIPLQFRMYVTNYSNLSLAVAPDNTNFPIRASVQLPDGIELTGTGAAEDIITKYYGEAYDAAAAQSTGNAESLARSFELGQNSFVSGRKLSDLVRRMPRSIGVSADVWNAIETGGMLEGVVFRQGQPIRGKISDNYDEYTGYAEDPGVDFGEYAQQAVTGTVRSVFESADFFRQAIESLACYGADINNPSAMGGLGFGFSASASASASVGFTAGFGAEAGSGLGSKREPGYKDPSLFTYAGVTDARGSVQRFVKSGAAAGFGFSVGFEASVSVEASASVELGASAGGGAGGGAGTGPQGAGIGPNGDATAFAFISVEGSLDASGQAKTDPAAVQARLNKQKFGFSADNPYGTACPPGGSGDAGGLSFSLP